MADGEDGCPAGREAEPESGEEFEIVDRSQLPSPGELRTAAKSRTGPEGWSAPILTLARKATGNLSASCGSALRAAAGLGGTDGGADGAARTGRLRPGTPRARARARGTGGRLAVGTGLARASNLCSLSDELFRTNLLAHVTTGLCFFMPRKPSQEKCAGLESLRLGNSPRRPF